MAVIGENLTLKSSQPNFERDKVLKLIDLKLAKPKHYDIGHIVYCDETKSHYVFRGENQPHDDVIGYFQKLIVGSEILKDFESMRLTVKDHYNNGQIIYCLESGEQYTFDNTLEVY